MERVELEALPVQQPVISRKKTGTGDGDERRAAAAVTKTNFVASLVFRRHSLSPTYTPTPGPSEAPVKLGVLGFIRYLSPGWTEESKQQHSV